MKNFWPFIKCLASRSEYVTSYSFVVCGGGTTPSGQRRSNTAKHLDDITIGALVHCLEFLSSAARSRNICPKVNGTLDKRKPILRCLLFHRSISLL